MLRRRYNGTWSITLSLPFPDDTYTLFAQSIDLYGGGVSSFTSLTASAQPLEIYTVPPTIVGAGYDARNGLIAFTVRGTMGPDLATLNNAANYVLSGYKSNNGPITIVGITETTNGTDTRVVLQLGNLPKKRPKKILLRVISGGVKDRAGNAMDGEFKGTVPTGDGHAGGDFIAPLPLKLKKK